MRRVDAEADLGELREADGRELARGVPACSWVSATITTSRSGSSAKPQRLPKPETVDRVVERAGHVAAGEGSRRRARPAPGRPAAGCVTVRAPGRLAQQRAAVELDDVRHRGRLGCEVGVRELHERVHRHLGEHRVEAALEAERGGGLGRHAAAAQRAGDVAGEELDAVVELAQALVQRAVERRSAFVARDREVGPPAVADEQRVARQHEPGLVAARAVGDDDAAVLRAVPGRVEDVERDVADLDAVAVAQRPVLVDRVRDLVDRDPAAVLLREDRRAPRRGRRAYGSRSRPTSCASWRLHSASTSRTSSGGSTTMASPATWQPTR